MWKARNAYRFDSVAFSVDAVIFRVVSDLKLASFAFGFKTSQLRGVLDSRLVEGWRVVTRHRRPLRLISWIRPPPGVVKLTVDGCSRGNPGMAASGGILRDSWGELLGTFGSFLGYRPILYIELMAVHESLELAAHLGHSILQVESDSATIGAWIRSDCQVSWDYIYLLRRVRSMASSTNILVRRVFWEATSATDFPANWVCTHKVHCRFMSPRDNPAGFHSILRRDGKKIWAGPSPFGSSPGPPSPMKNWVRAQEKPG